MKFRIVPLGNKFVIHRTRGGALDDKVYMSATDAAEAIRRKRKENKHVRRKRY